MGFDLSARNRKLGSRGYFEANNYEMKMLRAAMAAAGVAKTLIYKKFVSNDGLKVTELQSRQIAEKLTTWLKGRNLMLDLAEKDERAMTANEGFLKVVLALADRDQKKAARFILTGASVPLKVDFRVRTMIRQFAKFSHRSGGFKVY